MSRMATCGWPSIVICGKDIIEPLTDGNLCRDIKRFGSSWDANTGFTL